MFPMDLAAFFSGVFFFMPTMIKLAVTLVCLMISIKASIDSLSKFVQEDKYYMVLGPVIFYMFVLAVFVLSN